MTLTELVDVKLSLPITFRLPEQAQPDDARQDGARLTGHVFTRDGAPLPGTNIYLEGTTIGAATDYNGRFVINGMPDGTHTLVASFVGFETAHRTINSTDTHVQLRMQEQVYETGSIVITGYSE